MNGLLLAVLIIFGLIGLFILWRIFKPYFIRYDTTLAITGGLGSGKSLTTIKTAIVLLRKQRFYKYKVYNFWHVKIYNWFVRRIDARRKRYNDKLERNYSYYDETTNTTTYVKKGKKLKLKKMMLLREYRKMPMLYSNIPIHFKKHIFSRKREWNKTLTAPHILCLKEMEEFSIVVIDELPQFINQFNWNQELIQKNVNEFITFFRHYVGGYMLVNAQSIDDVVVQIRRKLNQATWCFDFKKWFFGLFYTIRMCDIMLSDNISTMSTTFVEENTRLHFGLFPPRKTYDTRCYSNRYKNIYKKLEKEPRYKKLKTNKVLRLVKYTSPLDDITTQQQKQQQWEKGAEVWEN